jgi:hypothetical protein
MPTYIIFDRKTGKAVQTHTQPEGLASSREELLAHVVASGQDPSGLEIRLVEAESLEAGRLFRVDPKSGKVQPADEKQATGFGAGSVESVEEADLRHGFKADYRPVAPVPPPRD